MHVIEKDMMELVLDRWSVKYCGRKVCGSVREIKKSLLDCMFTDDRLDDDDSFQKCLQLNSGTCK